MSTVILELVIRDHNPAKGYHFVQKQSQIVGQKQSNLRLRGLEIYQKMNVIKQSELGPKIAN